MSVTKEPVWNEFLTERDKMVFGGAGYGARAGYGERPALVIIDVNYAFVGDRREPILDSIKRWRNSCGEEGWDAVAVIKKLLTVARAKGLPVIYTTGQRREDNWDSGSWSWKNSRSTEDVTSTRPNLDGNEIFPEIAPEPSDLVIKKQKPSGFHGTNMMDYLVNLKVDTLLVTGTTTSGCVRASVVDAFSFNYRCAVIEDGCFDRSQASHAVNLCDMNAKYADVVASEDAIAYMKGLPDGLFKLPPGRPRLATAAE
jgi:nicotinamidase-related amidase